MIDKNTIPRHWNIVDLEEISEGKNGIVDGPFGSNLKNSDYIDDNINGVPVLTTKNLEGDYSDKKVRFISKTKFEELKRSQVIPGDILVAKIGSIGKTGIYPQNARTAIIPANLLKITVSKSVNLKFVFHYLNSYLLQKDIRNISTATAQPAFNLTKFRKLGIPLPPLSEQQQIVSKIEELFSELDKGKQQLESVRQQLKTYRQAVLKWAFEGRFTSVSESTAGTSRDVSRSKDNLKPLPEGWKWVKLGEVCKSVEYGSAAKSNEAGNVPVLRMGNIQKGKFDWADLVFTSNEEEILKYTLNKNDVLFNRTNSPELVGKTAIFKGERKAIFAGYLIRINRIKELIDGDYLNYFLNSEVAKKYGMTVKTDGVNQSNINGQKLKSYPIPLCSLEIQNKIVQEIETRLSVCDKTEEIIENSLRQVESLRLSILKQAFEGKLV